MPTTSTRGVIASAARFSPNRIVRRSSSAVSSGSAPALAEYAASRPSSSGERALASSSCGSTPSRRTSQFAEPLSARIEPAEHGGERRASGRRSPAPSRIGRAIAAFFGTSSPKSIESSVASASASTCATPSARVAERGAAAA